MGGSRSSLGVLALLVACASAGTRPHDMSTAGHEQAARDEDQLAARDDGPTCADRAVCWTETDASRADEERHRALAAEHRAAASALVAAEEHACIGLDEDTRDASPFMHRADVASVDELTEEVRVGHSVLHRTVGATIVFRAVRGMTAEWLQRAVDCHLARNAALGHEVPEMPDCPLVPRDVTARVRSTGNGFAVDVRSDDRASAEEVLRRARALVAPAPAP
jgi:hypothetical protein